jgi:glycosyltransferase involved in cell wall biosynthesis
MSAKLIIQIPCYNEEQTLGVTLRNLPRTLPGVDTIEWLVIDDGSVDKTVEVARQAGVDHIISLPQHRGLAHAFTAGIEACLAAGADLILNTDADNQYCADDIPALLAPLLAGQAEMVIGARPISNIPEFSPLKKLLQHLGSWVVRFASGTSVPDATSGFRAMSRSAAMKLHIFTEHTYTLETIIQAGHKGIVTASVPVRTNRELRPSRLVQSIPVYIQRQAATILRISMTYRPLRFFALPGALVSFFGILIGVRFLVFFISGQGQGHIQSLILAAILCITGSSLIVVGLLADLIAVNRKLLERIDWRVQLLEGKKSSEQQ